MFGEGRSRKIRSSAFIFFSGERGKEERENFDIFLPSRVA